METISTTNQDQDLGETPDNSSDGSESPRPALEQGLWPKQLAAHSLYLLRHVIENHGYCVTIALPCILRDGTPEPLGISMATMRGLEKRGYVTESHSGIWRATEEGKLAALQVTSAMKEINT